MPKDKFCVLLYRNHVFSFPLLFPKALKRGSVCAVFNLPPQQLPGNLYSLGMKERHKAAHVYQEEKRLLSQLSNLASVPVARFVMAGEIHLCPTQCFHKKAGFQVFIWTSVTVGLRVGGGGCLRSLSPRRRCRKHKYRGHREKLRPSLTQSSACSSAQWLKALKVSIVGSVLSRGAHSPLATVTGAPLGGSFTLSRLLFRGDSLFYSFAICLLHAPYCLPPPHTHREKTIKLKWKR